MLRLIPPVVAALVLLGSVAGVAVGDHAGRPIGSLLQCDRPGVSPPRCTSVGNNLRHFVYFDTTLSEGLASSLRDTMAEDYDPTDLRMYLQTKRTLITDVIAYSQDYGDNGAAGWVYCPRDAPQGVNTRGDRWCKQQELHFNLNPRYSLFFEDDGSRDHVACHELGHTLGLRHWGNPPQSAGPAAATCMNGNTPDGPVDLHQVDVDHINAYPYEPPPVREGIPMLRAPGATATTWAPLWPAGVEATGAETYGSLTEMTRAADAVVRGRVVSVAPGRVFGDRAAATLPYAAVELRVGTVIAGTLPGEHRRTVTLEIPLFDGSASLEQARRMLPGGEAIFFLRNKAGSARTAGVPDAADTVDANRYRLVTFGALVANEAGRAALTADAPAALARLGDRSFPEVVELVAGEGR